MEGNNPHADLKDIGGIVPLNEDDLPCINEIRDVLVRHGMLDRFGVTLLHSHFPVHDGETLVEFSEPIKRELLFKTLKQDSVPGGTVLETMWRLGEGEALMKCLMNCEKDSDGNHRYKHTSYPD